MSEGDSPGTRPTQRRRRNYPLLAITLPFVGMIFGASLEHGTNAVCRITPTDCKPKSEEVQAIRDAMGKHHELATMCMNSLSNALGRVQNAAAAAGAAVPMPPPAAATRPNRAPASERPGNTASLRQATVTLNTTERALRNDLDQLQAQYQQLP